MKWGLEDFLMMKCGEPGLLLGQVDCICEDCNCSYWAEYTEDNESGYACPNCGKLNNS